MDRFLVKSLCSGRFVLAVAFCQWAATPSAGWSAERPVRFNDEIRPLLAEKCFACHGPDANHRQADLRLDTRDGATGDLGGRKAIVPGKPEESELVRRITSDDPAQRMPPPDSKRELSEAEIQLLSEWVRQGGEYQAHWSLIPPQRPAIPSLRNAAWPRNAIDHFLLARLESEGLQPSAEADAATLVKRLHFDVLGLPPAPTTVDAMSHDPSPANWDALVDELLESPHYGERMAMHWLDLVRYADTVGYHGDQEHRIQPYRDWVIAAFNRNMPFDQFTREQLAGDLLPDATVEQRIASGYNRLLQTSHEGGVQVKEYLHKYDADRMRNFSGVWLGVTLGCAECHNHKYDPYTQKDFYSLAAFFADLDDLKSFKAGDTNPTKREPELEVLSPLVAEEVSRLEQELAASTAAPEREAANKALSERIAALKSQTQLTLVSVAVEPRTIRVLGRGDWMDESGPEVQPDTPGCLPPTSVVDRRPTRLDLAAWLMAPDHPQTSRVFVNRIWSLFFGAGLCRTLDDVGMRGETPTHPELLDWLAVEFRESGWNVKHLVRLIVTSRAYRMTSIAGPDMAARDSDNRLLARQNRWRLPAEMIRDRVLTLSGLLATRMGGPSARPYQPAGYYQHLNFPRRDYVADADDNQYRRGVYVHWQRQYLHPMLLAFDAPSREECTAQRPISNTPQAALTLLNDPTFVEASRMFAGRVLREGGSDDAARLEWAWRESIGRVATPGELAVLQQLLAQSRARFAAEPAEAEKLLAVGMAKASAEAPAQELAAWTRVSQALFNLHESIVRE